MDSAHSFIKWAQGVVLVACLIPPPLVSAQPTAHFELRLAPDQPDAIMQLGGDDDDSLDLEVWVDVSDGPIGENLWAFSVFLKASTDNVITYNQDFDGAQFFGCSVGGVDNTPFTGDFSPACFQPGGIPNSFGIPVLLGTFSVSAIAPGAVSYTFDDTGGTERPFRVSLTNLQDINGSNLTFSIDPLLSTIQVVVFVPSADADQDGDVDLFDFAKLQACSASNGVSPMAECTDLDLNLDGVVDEADVGPFVDQLFGPGGLPGDLDGDGDNDLKDFARYQVCATKASTPEMKSLCIRADVNRDQTIDLLDYAKSAENLTGPSTP